MLRNDLPPYNLTEEAASGGSGDDFDQGDNGWEIIHTDVFRFLHTEVCYMLILVWVPSSWPLALGRGYKLIRDFAQGIIAGQDSTVGKRPVTSKLSRAFTIMIWSLEVNEYF